MDWEETGNTRDGVWVGIMDLGWDHDQIQVADFSLGYSCPVPLAHTDS